MRETLIPVAAPDIARRLGPQASAERIAHEPLLHDSDTVQWRAWFKSCGQRYRPRASDRRFEDYDLVLAAAQTGRGVALLRAPLARAVLASERLMSISDHAIQNAASHWIVARAERTAPRYCA